MYYGIHDSCNIGYVSLSGGNKDHYYNYYYLVPVRNDPWLCRSCYSFHPCHSVVRRNWRYRTDHIFRRWSTTAHISHLWCNVEGIAPCIFDNI